MTREETVERLENVKANALVQKASGVSEYWQNEIDGTVEAIDMAIEALSADSYNDDLIIKGAKGIQDGLYNIKDGKLSKYYANGGIVQAYEIVPSADRKGHWIDNDKSGTFKIWDCSECGISMEAPWNFCPHCGADMRGGDDADQ